MSSICEEAARYRQFYHDQLLDNIVPFWMNSDLIDRTYGGYISSVDREGRCYNTDKSVWFQGRALWSFSHLCRVYGTRSEWKEAADLGKRFLEAYCTDTDGRMFFVVTREGKPLRKRRYMYSESFYAVGMAEYGAAFGDADALKKAEACFERMLTLYRTPEKDPFHITPKTYAETRSERASAVPMVLLSTSQILRRCDPSQAAYYTAATEEVIGDMQKYHYQPDLGCVLEDVLSDGSRLDNPAGRTINPGHSSENSWFLMSEACYTGDAALQKTALDIFDGAFARGWDPDFGGMLYFVDVDGRPCEQLEWDMKLWWVHNEVLIASLMAYGLTRDSKYWERFKQVHGYAFSHFADQQYGEWYGYLHRDGTVSHTQKGSLWKGPYHLLRCLMTCEELLARIAAQKPMTPIL